MTDEEFLAVFDKDRRVGWNGSAWTVSDYYREPTGKLVSILCSKKIGSNVESGHNVPVEDLKRA